jgi:predicted nuclease of restriction endonuclease-like (RecB) superfamily
MRDTRLESRNFYEVEAANNHWSVPQLQRQMSSFLFDRLSSSRDEQSVLNLARKGQVIESAEDSLKDIFA